MRTKCTVEKVFVQPFFTTGKRPFRFLAQAEISIWLTRTFKDGKTERAILEILLKPKYMTDGASTFWPISILVPQWIPGDDKYNAAPTAHDVLYMLEGIIESDFEPVKLRREEVDDILRGMWRCWGMTRFVAGCADKGIEIFAGGRRHWGSDGYGVRQFARAKWTVME